MMEALHSDFTVSGEKVKVQFADKENKVKWVYLEEKKRKHGNER